MLIHNLRSKKKIPTSVIPDGILPTYNFLSWFKFICDRLNWRIFGLFFAAKANLFYWSGFNILFICGATGALTTRSVTLGAWLPNGKWPVFIIIIRNTVIINL